MLDYNTLNNLVEAFNKNGVSNVKLENGSTLEIKEGQLLINGEPLSIDIGVINTDNITALSTETIEDLKAGDLVLKHTGNQIHAYKVTYKEEHQGICISYYDAGYTETVSYDYVDGAWVYNSTDVVTPTEYSAGNGISIENNTITNTKPDKQLYLHTIRYYYSNFSVMLSIICDSPTRLNQALMISKFGGKGFACSGVVRDNDNDYVAFGFKLATGTQSQSNNYIRYAKNNGGYGEISCVNNYINIEYPYGDPILI